MEPTIRLFVVEDGANTYVFDAETLAAAQIVGEAKEREAFGEKGAWRSVWLRKPLGKHAREIAERCRVTDPIVGFRMDSTREPAARCAVLVEKWEGFEGAPSFEAFESLPLPLAEALDGRIQAHMYPNILNNADFLKAWKDNSTTSETPTPKPE